MAVAYVYSGVTCKNCGSRIELEYLGPTVNVRIAGTITNPGQIRCMNCNEAHRYVYADIALWIKDLPPQLQVKHLRSAE